MITPFEIVNLQEPACPLHPSVVPVQCIIHVPSFPLGAAGYVDLAAFAYICWTIVTSGVQMFWQARERDREKEREPISVFQFSRLYLKPFTLCLVLAYAPQLAKQRQRPLQAIARRPGRLCSQRLSYCETARIFGGNIQCQLQQPSTGSSRFPSRV